jgi:hypothetical protein
MRFRDLGVLERNAQTAFSVWNCWNSARADSMDCTHGGCAALICQTFFEHGIQIATLTTIKFSVNESLV